MIVVHLVKSKVVSYAEPTLKFNVLDDPGVETSKIFSVKWTDPTQVSPPQCDPPNPKLEAGMVLRLALSREYCVENGISTNPAVHPKEPVTLAVETPKGGWFTLEPIPVKALMLKTKDGGELNVLDPLQVLPGSLRTDEQGLVSLVISEQGKAALALTTQLVPYAPAEGTTSSVQPAIDRSDRERARNLLMAIAHMLE